LTQPSHAEEVLPPGGSGCIVRPDVANEATAPPLQSEAELYDRLLGRKSAMQLALPLLLRRAGASSRAHWSQYCQPLLGVIEVRVSLWGLTYNYHRSDVAAQRPKWRRG
jgi:hypothetical protein